MIRNKMNDADKVNDSTKSDEQSFTLKGFVKMLFREKKTIVVVILAISFTTAIVNLFIIKPSYQCKTIVTLDVPELVITSAGEYKFITVDPDEYFRNIYDEDLIERTFSDLKIQMPEKDIRDYIAYEIVGDITKTTDGIVNAEISFTSGDKENLSNIANALTDKFTKQMKAIAKKHAINAILGQSLAMKDAYDLDIAAKTFKAEQAIAILEKIPVLVTVRQAIITDPGIIAKLLKEKNPSITGLTNDVLLSEIVNPAYEEMQLQLATINSELVEVKSLKKRNEMMIPDLEKELAGIDKFIKTGDSSNTNNDRYNVLDKRIEVASIASVPENPVSPRKTRNILIAVFLSAILGVFAAMIKNYWQKY
jgi:capsular polysaccharide biosynthesis protein